MTRFVRKDSRRGGAYTGVFTLAWEDGKRHSIALKTTHKRIAEKRLNEHLERLELEHEGEPVPAGHWGAPKHVISELVEKYQSHLIGSGRKPKHAHDSCQRIRFISKKLKWLNLDDEKPAPFERWRSGGPENPRTKQQLGHKTLNEYLISVNAFFDWAQKMGYTDRNPLRLIDALKTKGYEKKKRRAWTDEEFSRFMAEKPSYKTDYRSAVRLLRWTGLRVSELQSLTWGDVSLDTSRAFIVVRAHRTKNRKEQTLPLLGRAADILQTIRPKEYETSTPVLDFKIPASQQFRRDLEKLGITYRTEIGDLDFHSLRHTFGTWLVSMGVDLKEVQILMRHSDIRMTADRYTDVTRIPVARTLADLDKLTEFSDQSEKCAPIRAPHLHIPAHSGAQLCTDDSDSGKKKALENQGLKCAPVCNIVQGQEKENGWPITCRKSTDRNPRKVVNSSRAQY